MERNLLLAVSISLLIYVGWFGFVERRYGRPPAKETAAAAGAGAIPAGAGAIPAGAGAASTGAARPSSGEPSPKAAASSGAGAASAAPARKPAAVLPYAFPLSTQGGAERQVRLLFSPRGAALSGFSYPGPLGSAELIPFSEPGFFSTWPELEFKADLSGPSPVFSALHPSGLRLRKEYLFDREEGLNTLRFVFSNPGRKEASLDAWELALGPGLGTLAREADENPSHWAPIALLEPPPGRRKDRIQIYKFKGEPKSSSEPWRWLGLHNRYFLGALFPPSGSFELFRYGSKAREDAPKDKHPAPWLSVRAKALSLAPGESATLDVPFYLGPKDYAHLSRVGRGLERSVHFGFFNTLGRFIFKTLRFLHSRVGNWGWSIILLTLLVQAAVFPLTYKQMKSAAAMKRLQPEMARLQQKYAKDARRLNVEMMELYKKHGTNPLSGCFPILFQMPVFIALFNTLRNAWELNGAPWLFWIKDLSAKDPFYVLPLLMGGSMFVQAKLNPAPTADPAQAAVMTYMPLIFTFMFLKFPAGLVLYWLTGSLLNLGQQLWLKQRLQ